MKDVVKLQFMIVNLQALRIDLESSDEQEWEVSGARLLIYDKLRK